MKVKTYVGPMDRINDELIKNLTFQRDTLQKQVEQLQKDVAYWEKHHNALQRALNSRIQNEP